jgi:pimeloyl-ACP methyl ester carboxylesterase
MCNGSEQRLMPDDPTFLLHIQHGLSDSGAAFRDLARQLPVTGALITILDMDLVQTWLRIEPLIERAERRAADLLDAYPHSPMRIIGHSMGGLIWLEILHRNRAWWSRTESVVLFGSPVGGADLARIADPLGCGVGIARDLGISRRPMAEAIAAAVPMLVIAGDLDGGTSIRTWKNPLGVDHVFVAGASGEHLYGGLVGWIHAEGLRHKLRELASRWGAVPAPSNTSARHL